VNATDEFSLHYQERLDETYDCVDRIVLNAYFRLGQAAGGFRTWWRGWHGTDANLDKAHLMRYAGRFARRVRAYAGQHKIPLIECKARERKHEIAEPHIPQDPTFEGVFCILVGRAPAPVWDVELCSNGQPHLSKKTPWPYVNQYSFHIIDKQWGHVVIKLSPHPPFGAMIILNGHEWVAREARQRGVGFTKEGNCFTEISNAAGLASVAETMSTFGAVGQLAQVCERWIYSSCLVFALDRAEQERSGFRYSYSVYQCEYSRNLLFTSGQTMEQVFQSVIDRTRRPLNVATLKTIFGYQRRPRKRDAHGKPPRFEVVVERPVYDLTVFKIHFGKLTVKIYGKGERVLRIEVVVHNTRDLRCRRSVEYFPEVVAELKGTLERFLSILQAVDVSFLDDPTWERWPLPSTVGRTRVGGIQLHHPRMRAVLEAVVALSPTPRGFTASELAETVRHVAGRTFSSYTTRQASYDLKKLRGQQLVAARPRSRRYSIPRPALRAITAFIVLREKVLRPLLANDGRLPLRRPRSKLSQTEIHYAQIQREMQQLLEHIGIAA
jgi:hypothetical protein